MGDRFYTSQKNHKPKRELKKDVVIRLNKILGQEVEGLDRLTIKTLNELIQAIAARRAMDKNAGALKRLADE